MTMYKKKPPKRKTHCPKGHEYSGKNRGWNIIKGKRFQICRTCKAARAKAQYRADPVNRAKRQARALRYYYEVYRPKHNVRDREEYQAARKGKPVTLPKRKETDVGLPG